MSSTTTNLKNINFMSETRFDNLSEIKDDELYAVKFDELDDKADKDLNNMNPSQAAKATIVDWSNVDYSSGVSVSDITTSNPYQAPSDGVLYGTLYNATLYVNGNRVAYSDFTANSVSVVVVLSKNDTVTVSQNSLNRCDFYPLKGV